MVILLRFSLYSRGAFTITSTIDPSIVVFIISINYIDVSQYISTAITTLNLKQEIIINLFGHLSVCELHRTSCWYMKQKKKNWIIRPTSEIDCFLLCLCVCVLTSYIVKFTTITVLTLVNFIDITVFDTCEFH